MTTTHMQGIYGLLLKLWCCLGAGVQRWRKACSSPYEDVVRVGDLLTSSVLGGPWDLVTTYNWAYNPTYNWGNRCKAI